MIETATPQGAKEVHLAPPDREMLFDAYVAYKNAEAVLNFVASTIKKRYMLPDTVKLFPDGRAVYATPQGEAEGSGSGETASNRTNGVKELAESAAPY